MSDVAVQEKLAEISETLGRLDERTKSMHDRLASGTQKMDEHDARLRKVEGSIKWYAGAAAATGGILGYAAKKLVG